MDLPETTARTFPTAMGSPAKMPTTSSSESVASVALVSKSFAEEVNLTSEGSVESPRPVHPATAKAAAARAQSIVSRRESMVYCFST